MKSEINGLLEGLTEGSLLGIRRHDEAGSTL